MREKIVRCVRIIASFMGRDLGHKSLALRCTAPSCSPVVPHNRPRIGSGFGIPLHHHINSITWSSSVLSEPTKVTPSIFFRTDFLFRFRTSRYHFLFSTSCPLFETHIIPSFSLFLWSREPGLSVDKLPELLLMSIHVLLPSVLSHTHLHEQIRRLI
jgi:hypothetical protein